MESLTAHPIFPASVTHFEILNLELLKMEVCSDCSSIAAARHFEDSQLLSASAFIMLKKDGTHHNMLLIWVVTCDGASPVWLWSDMPCRHE